MHLDMPPGKGYLNLIHPSVPVMGEKRYCFQLLLSMDRLPHSSPSPGHCVLSTSEYLVPQAGRTGDALCLPGTV